MHGDWSSDLNCLDEILRREPRTTPDEVCAGFATGSLVSCHIVKLWRWAHFLRTGV